MHWPQRKLPSWLMTRVSSETTGVCGDSVCSMAWRCAASSAATGSCQWLPTLRSAVVPNSWHSAALTKVTVPSAWKWAMTSVCWSRMSRKRASVWPSLASASRHWAELCRSCNTVQWISADEATNTATPTSPTWLRLMDPWGGVNTTLPASAARATTSQPWHTPQR